MFPIICFGQYTSIPDQIFEQELIFLGYDNVIDGQVLTNNIIGIDSLTLDYGNINSLIGIEDFMSLTILRCRDNYLTSLDVSQNTSLTTLVCNRNQLTSLVVNGANSLKELSFMGNQLTTLDVSQNTQLVDIQGSYNQLTTLDVSNNTALTYLGCNNNQLTTLDVIQNTQLVDIQVGYNQLTTLDVSNNTALTTLTCTSNQLTNLDVSNNTALTYLNCQLNQLTTLDVSQNTLLLKVYLNANQLSSLDVSQNSSLTELFCGFNTITCLNLKNGNNSILAKMFINDNPNLNCIQVDDSVYSNANWINNPDFQLDSNQYFSENCNYPLGCFNINPNSVQEIPQSISLYPNPTKENITISIENFNGNIQTEIYDLLGNRLQSTNETTISLQYYPRGIYFLKVAYGDRVEEIKVIKD